MPELRKYRVRPLDLELRLRHRRYRYKNEQRLFLNEDLQNCQTQQEAMSRRARMADIEWQ